MLSEEGVSVDKQTNAADLGKVRITYLAEDRFQVCRRSDGGWKDVWFKIPSDHIVSITDRGGRLIWRNDDQEMLEEQEVEGLKREALRLAGHDPAGAMVYALLYHAKCTRKV